MRKLYAVFDRKAGAYGPVVSAAHDAVATRDFSTACSDPQSSLNRYAEDYELHLLAVFEDDGERCGAVSQLSGYPAVVVTASAVKSMSARGPELLKEG